MKCKNGNVFMETISKHTKLIKAMKRKYYEYKHIHVTILYLDNQSGFKKLKFCSADLVV